MSTAWEPVTLHLLTNVQGHHSGHWTEFVLTTEGGSPDVVGEVISRVTYPTSYPSRAFAEEVAEEMDTVIRGGLTVHRPRGWVDHVSYNGLRSAP